MLPEEDGCEIRAERRPEVDFRPFCSSDADTIAGWVFDELELHWLAPSMEPPLTPFKVKEWQQSGGEAFVFVSQNVGVPIAYGELNPFVGQNGDFWIGHCVVAPDFRGRRIGRAFVHALLAEAFDHRWASRVSLIVFPDNAAALACYRHAGFRDVGREAHMFVDGISEQLLRLEVTRREYRARLQWPQKGRLEGH